MKAYQPGDIRNFAIVGHASCGKTMLSESMLACGGVINRLGSVQAGSTVSDYSEAEQKRQISIGASVMHLEWGGKKFNFIDTPGYQDFISEALGALRVSDLAVVVVHAVDGVGVGTGTVWNYATEFGLPKVFVINGADREHVDFDKVLNQLRERYGSKIVPITVPVNPGPGFNQVIDALRANVATYETDGMGKYTEAAPAGELAGRVRQLHQELVEKIAESDDALLEKFFEKGTLSDEELRAAMHTAVMNQTIIPLFVTAASNNVGVARFMDYIAKHGVSPADRPPVKVVDGNGKEVEISVSKHEPVLFVFKTVSEAHVGDLSFFRVYSGTVLVGKDLYNTTKKATERIGQVFQLNGKNRVSVNQLSAGELGAVVKLKNTHTGNTLAAPGLDVSLPPVTYPKPNIHAAMRLKSKGEEDKIAVGLAALHDEDPTFLYHVDSELHQTVMSGQGELHLQVVSERLKTRYKVDFDLIEPKIPYRETIKTKGDSKYRHKKQTGGAGQFAEVWMRIEPKPRNTGLEFTESLVGQNVDRVFVPSVQKGVNSAATEGVLAGYRVVDLLVEFYDGKMHPVDSKDIAFQIAGKEAFREAFLKARPCLLEPIYHIEVKIPDDYMGAVIGDLSSRRGKIQGMDSEGGFQIVKATVPQQELYQYGTVLRSLTGGRGVHKEDFSHYEEMPREMEEKVITEAKKAREQKAAE
jgi:elongation factor G